MSATDDSALLQASKADLAFSVQSMGVLSFFFRVL